MLAIACALAIATPSAVRSNLPAKVLRVCADPNNLPFSNRQGEGFENGLAELIAHELRAAVEYTWWPQRRGFIRNTLDAGACDVVMGVPAGFEPALTTQPYYRSSYVFLTRRDRKLALSSLDDPRLARLRLGVQMPLGDFANTPPGHALSARGIVRNVVGYSVLGNYAQPNPAARIVDAVATREIEAALVWGPLAGYFGARAPVPLEVTPIRHGAAMFPFEFDISMAVRRGDTALRGVLNRAIDARRADIGALLDRYHVPRPQSTKEPLR